MSDTFEATRTSFRRLKDALLEADDDTRSAFVFWILGLVMMAIAIIGQFGWLGFLFCVGVVVRTAGQRGLNEES